jgi:NADH-quinone oxidoreductase subunit E
MGSVTGMGTQAEEARIREEAERILAGFGTDRSELIPILQSVQEALGYIPQPAIRCVADHLRMTDVQIYGVASFYNHFRFTPLGRHPVQMCMGTACHMVGGGLVLDALERSLDIQVGGITEDKEFSLDRVACVGCCGLAPVMVIGGKIYAKMSPTKVDEALVNLKIQTGKDAGQDVKDGPGGP